MARRRGEGEATGTKSVDNAANAIGFATKTAGSRDSSGDRNDDAAAGSERSIEQVFSQSACLRRGHMLAALQQHDARDDDVIIAIDGSVIARMTNAAKSLRTESGL